MVSNNIIYISANLVIEQYQDDVLYHVADKLARARDSDGIMFWSQIFSCVTEIQSHDPEITLAQGKAVLPGLIAKL